MTRMEYIRNWKQQIPRSISFQSVRYSVRDNLIHVVSVLHFSRIWELWLQLNGTARTKAAYTRTLCTRNVENRCRISSTFEFWTRQSYTWDSYLQIGIKCRSTFEALTIVCLAAVCREEAYSYCIQNRTERSKNTRYQVRLKCHGISAASLHTADQSHPFSLVVLHR